MLSYLKVILVKGGNTRFVPINYSGGVDTLRKKLLQNGFKYKTFHVIRKLLLEVTVGAEAAKAARRKYKAHEELIKQNYTFVPFAVETLGLWSEEAMQLVNQISSLMQKYAYLPVNLNQNFILNRELVLQYREATQPQSWELFRKVTERNVDPEWTLLYYLRKKLRLCGTKLGCGEGGCGACTVMVSRYDRKLQIVKHLAINACLAPICSMHGLAVTTVEGIGSTKTKLHPVQERIAKAHGLQCGFCTPGIVMSMYALLRNSNKPTMKDVEISFQGNLCRCTGYRPIIEGYKTFSSDGSVLMENGIVHEPMECGMGKNCCRVNGVENGTESEAESKLFDSRTFSPYDPTQEPIFPPELKIHDTLDHQNLAFKGETVTWFRPTTLNQLLELKQMYQEAKLVVGNTEVGIEVRFKNCVYPILIQPTIIQELTEISLTENGLRVGASATLLELENVLNKQITRLPEYKTRIFVAIRDMLHWFGSKQIRSVASVGGNIMTSSPISDLNPIFVASEVKLDLHSNNTGPRVITMDGQFFTGYRKNVVRNDEILSAIHIPFSLKHQYVCAYKQSRRRDDDIAIVNFALNVVFKQKSNIVSYICGAFGGMAPTTVTAPTLAKFFVGKPWNEETFNLALKYLIEDLPLSPDAPGGMVEYRKSLSLSFFFKAFLKVSEQLQQGVNECEKSSLIEGRANIMKSSQYFEIYPTNGRIRAVGKPIPHISAFNAATGEAVFCDDIPSLENELYMAFVTSTKSHAKMISIDSKEALDCTGVHAFYCHKDIPKDRNVCGMGHDEEIFASDIVFCQGQVIGIIIADNQIIAQNAASKVKITYQVLEPVIVTIEDAIYHKSFFHQTPKKFEIGDIDEVFKSAPHIIEGDCRTGAQEHFYLETHSVIAVPKGEDNEMEIFCSTQDPTQVSKLVAQTLDVPQNRIITRVKRIGGAFGGKDSRSPGLPLAAAIAASKLNRPIRCMLNRDEDMVMTGTRNPFYIKYKTAFDHDGKILGGEWCLYVNAGYSLDASFLILLRAMHHFENAYKIPAVRATGYVCRTNLPSCTAFRAFGAPQAMFAGESIIRRIAEYLEKDPVKVAYLNLYKEGELTNYNQMLHNCNLEKCWNECITHSDFLARRLAVEKFNRLNKWRKRGISMLPTRYGVGLSTPFLSQAGALLHVYTDGSILLNHGGVEMGQGLHTKMVQVASTVLNVPYTKIYICETSTDKVPNTTGTIASLGSDLNGSAVMAACEIIKQRLQPYKQKNPKGKWEDWVLAAYTDRVSLSATGFYKIPTEKYGPKVKIVYDYHTYGAACSEVEIDCLTGDHQVLRTDIVMDVGESLNPAIDVGQIEGAFMQGYGLFVQEEMLYSPKGEVLTKGPGTYKVPSFGNVPLQFNVSLLKGSSNPRTVYSSKAVGEPPLFLACSVLFAIREAIKAARIDSGLVSTDFKLDAPATSAKIRMACQDHLTALIEGNMPVCSFVPWNVIP